MMLFLLFTRQGNAGKWRHLRQLTTCSRWLRGWVDQWYNGCLHSTQANITGSTTAAYTSTRYRRKHKHSWQTDNIPLQWCHQAVQLFCFSCYRHQLKKVTIKYSNVIMKSASHIYLPNCLQILTQKHHVQ
jgi:hypothetical protein